MGAVGPNRCELAMNVVRRVCDNPIMTAHRRLRLMRGAGAAIFATFVALMSHLLGGGMMPGALGIALPLGLALPLCLLLLERRASMPRLAVAVVASQVFFHVLFVVGSPGRATSTGGHLGHGAAGEVQVAIDAAAPSAHGNSTMWIWHVAAAVVTTFALGGGHAAIGRLADQWSAAWRS